MSYSSITEASRDQSLLDRIAAAVFKEAQSNPAFGDTVYGRNVLAGSAQLTPPFAYPVAIDTEDAYESAVAAGNPDAGGDPAVITDAAILSSVQARWPPDPEPPAP
jgi:hypothetical protein